MISLTYSETTLATMVIITRAFNLVEVTRPDACAKLGVYAVPTERFLLVV